MLNIHGLHPRHLRSLLPLRQSHNLLRHKHLSRRLALHRRDLHVSVWLTVYYNHAWLLMRMKTWLGLVMWILLTRLRRLCRGNSDLLNRLGLHKTLPSLYHPSLAWRLAQRYVLGMS